MYIARNLGANKVGFVVIFTFCSQLYFSNYQPFIGSMKLVNLENMISKRH